MTTTFGSRRPIPSVLVKFVLAGVAALGVGVLSAGVAQSPAPASRPTDDALALQVRQAVADDPVLRPHHLSLLVNVLDGVVVIGGPVPDAKLTAAIESAAGKVPGVVRVKVSVWAVGPPATNPLADRLGEKLSDKLRPAPAPVPGVALAVPTDPTARPDPSAKPDPRPTAGVAARTVPPPSVLQSPVVSVEHTAKAAHTRPPGAEPPEYTPIPATNLPTEPVLEPPTPVRAAPPREAELTRADSEGWKRDPRFARLTVDVRDGTAVIAGRARTHEAAWELAEEVRVWPGVARVVVGRVEVGR